MSARWQLIRAKAALVREQYRQELQTPVSLPLLVEHLAESVYLLSAFADPNLQAGIDGELNTLQGTIRLRPGMSPQRERFIIAHELGHQALEAADRAFFQDNEATLDERAGGESDPAQARVQAYNTRERHEQEANLFALELIIPADDLWERMQQANWTVAQLAATYGVSTDAITAQLLNVSCLEPVVATTTPCVRRAQLLPPNAAQQAAIDAPLPTLVVAGPGTGKTRSIVAKYLQLVAQGIDPARILALTYSNKAAEEMRERILAAMDGSYAGLAGRVEISTFHAWGLNFLKSYGHHVDLPARVQLRDEGDLYILLKRHLATLPLHEYKSLLDPGQYLLQIMHAFSHAKDELCGPVEYAQLAEAEAERLVAAAEASNAGKTTKKAKDERDRAVRDAARLRELAAIYARYQALLREEGVLDYGDLIMVAVAALHLPAVAARATADYDVILVDEFQDINYASGVLIALLAGRRGNVWAVGDPWQSIYRFRGASPVNLADFGRVYPGASIVNLDENYRSVQPILDASHALMAPDPLAGERAAQRASRPSPVAPNVVTEWAAPDGEAEMALIAHDILRRVGGRRLRRAHCVHRSGGGAMRRISAVRSALHSRRRPFADHVVLCRKHSQARAIAATLEAHGIPVDVVGTIYDRPEVQDALALCAAAGSTNSAGVLRVLTTADYALAPADMAILVESAHATYQALPRATHDRAIVAELSPAGQATLARLQSTVETLNDGRDAWQMLTHSLLMMSAAHRERLQRAGRGDEGARRELATLGQLVLVARTFVRQAPPDEQGATAFLQYVRLLIEAGVTATTAALPGAVDAVRIMTVHAAKGLEFPIVYVPGLQQDVYPSKGPADSIPELPTLAHGTQLDAMAEERYLLYVAMTRAQDRLILSRARARGDKAIKRSVLLPAATDAPWPIRERQSCRTCTAARPIFRLATPTIRWPVPASSLESYERCARQFMYQYGYQLYDDASPYMRMHRVIRTGVSKLAGQATSGTLPADEATLRDHLWSDFAAHELTDVLYSDDYFAEAWTHVAQYWSRLEGGTIEPNAVDRGFILRRPAGNINVRVDQIDRAGDDQRWLQTKSGRQGSSDHLSMRIMLYTLAYAATHGTTPNVAIHYTATGETRVVSPDGKVLSNHTAKIDELLAGIRAGEWEPSPGPQCRTCAFNLICPV